MMRLLTLFLAASLSTGFTPAMEKTFRATQSIGNSPLFRNPASSTSERSAQGTFLEQTELPQKIYKTKDKETPKVLGGLKIGLRELVVITGASSGLGLYTAASLAKTGKYFVVMACRDVEKGKQGRYLRCSRTCAFPRGSEID